MTEKNGINEMTEMTGMGEAMAEIKEDPDFAEKIDADRAAVVVVPVKVSGGRKNVRGECAWERKRRYKKRMVRRFLSMNPAMDYSRIKGHGCPDGIYLDFRDPADEDYKSPRKSYWINPYTRIYISPRGDLRKYNGDMLYDRSGDFALCSGYKNTAKKMTNRRIRRVPVDAELPTSESCRRKAYGPRKDEFFW